MAKKTEPTYRLSLTAEELEYVWDFLDEGTDHATRWKWRDLRDKFVKVVKRKRADAASWNKSNDRKRAVAAKAGR